MNLGSVLNFRNWTITFNVLIHGGFGYSTNKPSQPNESSNADLMLNLMAGITPQIRLGKSVALTGDLRILEHVRNSQTWDGTQPLNTVVSNNQLRGLNGYLVNASIGLTLYLGKNEVHADWYSEEAAIYSELEELDSRISKIETDMIDSDQDGVPNYLDREPTPFSELWLTPKDVPWTQITTEFLTIQKQHLMPDMLPKQIWKKQVADSI